MSDRRIEFAACVFAAILTSINDTPACTMHAVAAESAMIKDVVSLDGTDADERRIAAVAEIAEYFDAQVIGLFLIVLPLLVPVEWEGLSAVQTGEILEQARRTGASLAAHARDRLATLPVPAIDHSSHMLI